MVKQFAFNEPTTQLVFYGNLYTHRIKDYKKDEAITYVKAEYLGSGFFKMTLAENSYLFIHQKDFRFL